MIDTEILQLFTPYLQPGETVIWTDRPAKGVRFSAIDILLIPFNLFWISTVIQMVGGGVGKFLEDPPPFGALIFFMIVWMFLLIFGLHMVLGRFIVDIWVRRSTVYALTTKRALVKLAWPRPKLIDANLADRATIVLKEEKAERGTLSFGNDDPSEGRGLKLSFVLSFLNSTPTFVGIPDARRVYHLAVAGRDKASIKPS